MNLLTILETTVEDPRRTQGQRITLGQLLSIIIISNLCGYFGGRAIARFSKEHKKTFTDVLKLSHEIPSHVTFKDILNRMDCQQVIIAFNKWASFYAPMSEEDLFSGDGKALASTFKGNGKKHQEFEAIVSLFSHKSGLVHAISQYQNKKKSEIDVVLFLIKNLQNKGMTIVLDALHAQKKR